MTVSNLTHQLKTIFTSSRSGDRDTQRQQSTTLLHTNINTDFSIQSNKEDSSIKLLKVDSMSEQQENSGPTTRTTTNDIHNTKSMSITTQVVAALSAGTLSTSVGSNVAFTSSIIPLLLQEADIVSQFRTASWLATVFLITAVPSALSGGMLSDRFGRRKTAMFACFPLITGHILVATATSFPLLLAGRSLQSLGVWIGYPCANVLVSEVVHPDVRGTLGVFPSVMLSVGMFISYLLGYLLDSWRWMAWILVAQPVATFFCMLFIKESPYWLIQHDRKSEAEVSLRWYRGQDYDIKPELSDMLKKKEENELMNAGRSKSIVSIIFSGQFLRAQLTSGVLFFWAQYTGISALVIFMINIFQDANLSFDSRLAPVLVGATRILFGVFSSFALKKGNRKYIFCGSTVILSVCTLCLAILSYYRENNSSAPSWLGFLPFPFVLVMFMAHSFGVNPVLHLITAEVYPTAIRSLGNGSVMCMATGGNALQSVIYPHLNNLVGVQGCFLWFSISAVLLAMYGYFIIPDNRGLTLANIERGMEENKKKETLA